MSLPCSGNLSTTKKGGTAMKKKAVKRRDRGQKEEGIPSGERVQRAEVGGPGECDALTDEQCAEIRREIEEWGFAVGNETKH
jgi:hypothetical protein